MIEHKKNQDIFKIKADAIVQQCNCFHTMGSGIAAFIRENFPEAYLADKATKLGDPAKMGTFSFAKVKNDAYPDVSFIVNLYSQFDCASDRRCTRYDALVDGLTLLRDRMRAKANGKLRTIAIPYRIGCNRGGGDWNIVLEIIASIFETEKDFKVLICEPPTSKPIQNTVSK
jgi:O-acetyl-ADP-ribose deacetylase (regulator of RNase III)